jgi:PTH1 family peptidyl-tRNA hydrolase
LGTDQYWRLRIGIGHPGVKSEVANWVLKKPAPDQRAAIEDCITRTSLALPHLLSGDMVKATQLIHTAKPQRPKPPRPATLPGTKKIEAKDAYQAADQGDQPT